MTVAFVHVVDVVIVGDHLMAAARTMLVGVVCVLGVRKSVFVVVTVVGMVGMTIVNVVKMPVVLDGGVSAGRSVLVLVVIVYVVLDGAHGCSLL